MGTGERPSLNSDEGRFEYLRGELKVIKEHAQRTTKALENLDESKVDKATCALKEQSVRTSLREIKAAVSDVATSVTQTVNGHLEGRVAEAVEKKARETATAAELERLRAHSKPLLKRIKENAATLSVLIALLTSLGGGAYWFLGLLVDKLDQDRAERKQTMTEVRRATRRPVVFPMPTPPVYIYRDAGAEPPRRYRRRRTVRTHPPR